MKLVRYGDKGAEKPGLIDKSGQLRDLSAHIKDLTGETYSPASLKKLAEIDPASLPSVPGTPRLGPPVTGISKFVAIGLNYADHAKETGAQIPTEPIFFLKANTALSGPNDPVEKPRGSTKLDWEVEIAAIIGTRAKYVSEADALNHVAGYCVCNDVSERYFQQERGGQWTKGKSCDTFGPIGPWLVTKDEVPDPQNLPLWLKVNGETMQNGSTKLDWEVEIAAIIGTRAKYVSEADALNHVAGYCVCNDVSERNFQIERLGQWTKGKSHDTFGPLGPWLVTRDEISDVQKLSMWLDVNGQRRQTGSTTTMIFSMAQCIAYVSQFMTLLPGDVITTGTPPGVGMGMKPQQFLNVGDVVTLGIEQLGEQRQEIVAA